MRTVRVKGEAHKRLETALKNLEGKIGKVGWFKDSQYESGTPVAYVAAIQEFGDPIHNIPPRPFMRPAIIQHEHEWRRQAELGVKAILAGRFMIGEVMEGIGQLAAGHIRENIAALLSPPLSPRTIYARLHRKSDKKTIGLLTKPLIDTGILYGTLINTVEDK